MKDDIIRSKINKLGIENNLQYLLAIIFILLIVISTPLFSKESNIVRIAMSTSPLSSPFIIAHKKGYFEELGVNIVIQQVKGGNLSLKSVLRGEADIATSSEAVVMFNSFKRDDFSVFSTFVTSDNDVKILARKESGIKNINDLKGKKVGTILGTSAHFFLSHSLLMRGISDKDVNISNLKPQNSTKILKNKKLDAIVTWEPYAFLVQKELGEQVNHDRVYVETFNAISKKDYATKHPEILSNIIKALIKATDFINKNPTKTQTIVAEVLGKDLNVIKSTWKDFDFDVGLDQWLLNSLESEARWAIEHKFSNNKTLPNYINYINIELLKNIDPARVSIY